MTWEMFLVTREWAQEVALQSGYPVYLVGSTLWKPYSRDLDISILMPLADFESIYGVIPEEEEERKAYLTRVDSERDGQLYGMTLATRLMYAKRVDCKIQPDTWFPERDRLLLAMPNSRVNVRCWTLIDVKGRMD